MIEQNLKNIIKHGETLTIEFKSDRGPLSDSELLDTVVCLANARGGLLLVGVEDDGQLTGLHRKHRTRPEMLAAFIASRTVPPLSVRVAFERISSALPEEAGKEYLVAFLEVPAALQPISTSDGRLLVRYLDPHGEPGCRPLYPHELASWQADRGQLDISAQPIVGTKWEDLDPLEFVRLRRMVKEYRGDKALLELGDMELARALGLVVMNGSQLIPTMAGLLLVGEENALYTHIPAHEVAFQVLRGNEVLVNEFYRWPLLRIIERIYQAFEIRNEEGEVNIGAFRVPVPAYDVYSFREAVNNALIHRDYRRLGAVHVQLHGDYIAISNPGGFVEGIRANNLLVVNPRPRNPRLTDCFKRIGLVERIGRGVNIIFQGQLKNGHNPPTYEYSSEVNVNVHLYGGTTDLNFVRLLINQEREQGRSFDVSELLILNHIHNSQKIELSQASNLIQRSEKQAQTTLAGLVASGLLERKKDKTYHFSAKVQSDLDLRVSDPRNQILISKESDLDALQIEQMILEYVRTHGQIARRDVVELCGLTVSQAAYRLRQLTKHGVLIRVGKSAATVYKEPSSNNHRTIIEYHVR